MYRNHTISSGLAAIALSSALVSEAVAAHYELWSDLGNNRAFVIIRAGGPNGKILGRGWLSHNYGVTGDYPTRQIHVTAAENRHGKGAVAQTIRVQNGRKFARFGVYRRGGHLVIHQDR